MEPTTGISQAYPDRVEVRGRDLTSELMGKLSFTEYFYLLLTGREATEEQRFFLDLLLVAIAEHGMMPTNVAARMTLAAEPRALQGAVAAGILGAGPVLLGTSEACAGATGRGAEEGRGRRGARRPSRRRWWRRSRSRASGCRGSGIRCTSRLDPRAEVGSSSWPRSTRSPGPHVELAHAFGKAVNEGREKPLTLNISMPMAAVMLDLGFTADTVKAVPLLARTAGLLAHLAEEKHNPVGFQMAKAAEDSVSYEPPGDDE